METKYEDSSNINLHIVSTQTYGDSGLFQHHCTKLRVTQGLFSILIVSNVDSLCSAFSLNARYIQVLGITLSLY